MATIASKKSLIQEIVDSGGELIARGLSKAQFYQLTARYPEMLMEREKNGNITIMTPVKGGSGIRENKLNYRLNYYCEKHLGGQVFSPSTGFDLPNGAIKSPDAAWLSLEKMARISPEKIEDSFIPEVPDFVVEILSKSDSLKKLQKKMEETWIKNGVQLAWLIDPYKEKAYIYRANGSMETVPDFEGALSGENVLPGFSLKLSEFKVWGKR